MAAHDFAPAVLVAVAQVGAGAGCSISLACWRVDFHLARVAIRFSVLPTGGGMNSLGDQARCWNWRGA